MKWLGDEERDRFVKFQELFETAGWQLLSEFSHAKVTERMVAGANAKSWEENRLALGQRLAWAEIANAAQTFMSSFEQLAESNKEAAETPEPTE